MADLVRHRYRGRPPGATGFLTQLKFAAQTRSSTRKNRFGFADGKIRVLITKPSIASFGMNWQHCNNMAFVGLTSHTSRSIRPWPLLAIRPDKIGQCSYRHDTRRAAIWRNVSKQADSHDAMKREMREAMQRNAGVR